MRQRRRLLPLVVAVPLLLSAGCTSVPGSASPAGGSTTAARTTTPESTPTSAEASPADEEDPTDTHFPADTTDGGPSRAGSVADPPGQMHVSGIRVSSRNGYTRLQSDVELSPGPGAEARTTGSFEGSEEVLIGTRGGKAPFRAFSLTDPGRIVIDVVPAG